MPLTTTHALLPVAAAIGFSGRPVPWRLVIAAMVAAALPDLDMFVDHFSSLPETSVYLHRGAAHSLFVALGAGLLAAAMSRRLKAPPLAAGVAVAAAMASHGLLDMMTNSGRAVAYLWPVSSVRLFADWRPIHSNAIGSAHLLRDLLARLQSELWQLIVPMFAIAFAIRLGRHVYTNSSS